MTCRRRTIALALTSVAALALAACGDGARKPGSIAPAPSQSGATTPTASASGTMPTAATMRVAVYYLGDTKVGPRLYREFRVVPKTSGVIRAAVEAMLHLAPLDPDYTSVWPRTTTVRNVTVSGTTATVDLSAEARSAGAGAESEKQSLQQLVHTVTAAAPTVTAVQLLVAGAKVDTLWGHVDTRNPIRRLAQYETLAAVWVIDPASGAHVSRSMSVSGVATVYEATVSWSLTYPCAAGTACRTITKGFVTASTGAPGRGTWTVTTTVPPTVSGEVVFTAWESSAEDGSVTFPDSKTYRVG